MPTSFQKLKADNIKDALSMALLVDGVPQLRLIPVGAWVLGNERVITEFASWRSHASKYYFSQIQPTYDSMATYLQTISIQEENSILFLLEDTCSSMYGHLGVRRADSNSCEIDSVMRNPFRRVPGGMYRALTCLINEMISKYSIYRFELKVLSTNEAAIRLYKGLGFKVSKIYPLREVSNNGVVELVPTLKENSNRRETMIVMKYRVDGDQLKQ